jgi:predicted AlkP superfamily phosphohydrolase/phosphomutase
MNSNSNKKRVIILGFDGLDPKLTQKWMEAGLLPNFAKLAKTGTFSKLTTTNPPETAAAWAAFSTGQNPGKTGVFDFVIRDPVTYTPLPGLITLERDPKGGPPRPKGARKGIPMWKIIGDHGLNSTVLNLPVTWPPEKFNGRLLSGMGVPDISGRGNRAGFYSTAIKNPEKRFSVWEVAIEISDGVVDTILFGPGEQTIPIQFEIDTVDKTATVNIQGTLTSMDLGHLSEWCEVGFPVGDNTIYGMCRFCVLETEPELRIYCSPVQIHPAKPFLPISNPPSFATELYEALGPYRTQGREVDIFNLQENIIEDDVLLEDTFLALEERERMTFHFINHNKDDLIISWFGVVDTTQHGYWRFTDPKHPLYTPEGEVKYGDAIQKVYQWHDSMVGRILDVISDATVLIIASDHGCADWQRSVDFNSWLMRSGFLTLLPEEEAPEEGESVMPQIGSVKGVPFSRVDWSQTKAYSIGMGKIYLNLRGREGQGIVNPGAEAVALEDEIIESYLSWRDPANGNPVVSNVYRSRDVQWGPYMNRAPDLIVGLHTGYRVAFSSVRQITLGDPLKDNDKKISGDHVSVDYELVPGTILSNVHFDLSARVPHLLDIAPTVLEYLSLDVPKDMDGRSLWSK